MPFTVETIEGILTYRGSGVYGRRDIDGILAHLALVESAGALVPDRIYDFTAVDDFDVPFAEVAAVADQVRKRHYPNPYRAAFVAYKPVQVGFTRMYQTLARCDAVTYQIFPVLPDALRWIHVASTHGVRV